MDNSYFIYTSKEQVTLERFHICTWEFDNDSSLVEFGFEVSKTSIKGESLSLSIFIPWFNSNCETNDLYNKLSIADNSRFIFNDSISSTDTFDGGKNKFGVVHKFSDRGQLCVLPLQFAKTLEKIVTLNINLQKYNEYKSDNKPNIYFRFSVKPKASFISMRKRGISKSTIIYDIKVNERRNIPEENLTYFADKLFCEIKTCFSFNIIPNKYDIVFFENSSLKNVRTLEFDSFNKYLSDKRVKKDELIVVFNKKQSAESFSFFSIYAKERVGIAQFSLAIMLNLFCGFLFFVASIRTPSQAGKTFGEIVFNLSFEIYIAVSIMFITVLYFLWPSIANLAGSIFRWIKRKLGFKS